MMLSTRFQRICQRQSPPTREAEVWVILDLRDDVSAPLLKLFLSYVPEDFDDTTDLRWKSGTDGLAHFFVIQLPVPPGDD